MKKKRGAEEVELTGGALAANWAGQPGGDTAEKELLLTRLDTV